MMTPPTAPMPRIGTNTLVIIAGGKLSSIPMVRPISHPEHGISIRMITKPMANRLKNAPSSAARLSGKDIGSIDSTVSAPNTRPHRFAKAKRDIFFQSGVFVAKDNDIGEHSVLNETTMVETEIRRGQGA